MEIYTPEIHLESRQFSGTTKWYKYNHRLLLTDGVKWLADKLSCYYLVDDIGIYSFEHRQNDTFGVAILETAKKGRGTLYIEDGNDNVINTFEYPYISLYIDNPPTSAISESLGKMTTKYRHRLKLYMAKSEDNRDVLMLPSEY